MRLRDGVTFAFSPLSSIFIRGAYKYFWHFIENNMINNATFDRLIITGNPGIGKTYFGYYLLAQLRERFRDTLVVVYESAISQRRYLFKGLADVHVGTDIRSFDVETDDPQTWCALRYRQQSPVRRVSVLCGVVCYGVVVYFDASERRAWVQAHATGCPESACCIDLNTGRRYIVDGAGAVRRSAKTIVIASPKKSNIHEFAKLEKCTKRFMPIWSIEEMEGLRQLSFANITQSTMEELFNKWGGVPRFVLQLWDDNPTQESLLPAVNSADVRHLLTVIGKDMAADTDTSHMVAHVVTSEPYDHFEVKFANQYITNQIYTRWQTENEADLLFFISSKLRPETAGLRGQLFEIHAHNLLQRGGEFNIRELSGNSLSILDLPKNMEVVRMPFARVTREQVGKYVIPKARNAPAVDAWIPPSIMFQMTVSSTHPVSAAGIEALLDIAAKATPLSIDFDLYFVVRDDVFLDFKQQSYVNKDEQARKRQKRLQDGVKQYALCISTSAQEPARRHSSSSDRNPGGGQS